jgi:hypothetical protein
MLLALACLLMHRRCHACRSYADAGKRVVVSLVQLVVRVGMQSRILSMLLRLGRGVTVRMGMWRLLGGGGGGLVCDFFSYVHIGLSLRHGV